MSNPYDFVPFENSNPKRDYNICDMGLTQGKLASVLYSGEISCTLSPETPLFIHGANQQRQDGQPRGFFQRNRQICIPANSLKGLIRSVAEVVSDSCMSTLSDKYEMKDINKHYQRYFKGSVVASAQFKQAHAPITMDSTRVPEAYLPCRSLDALCLCCALFGMVERDEENRESSEDKRALAGRLFFTDAISVSAVPVSVEIPARGRQIIPTSGAPHPFHKEFYFASGKAKGRKFYYHHSNYQQTLSEYNKDAQETITLQARKDKFTFSIKFKNLTKEELNVLIYALELEPDMRHHFGYGKPYGLGSVKITVDKLKLMKHSEDEGKRNGPQRFLSYSAQGTSWFEELSVSDWKAKVLGGQADADAWVREAWGKRPNFAVAQKKLKEILNWNKKKTLNELKYPPFSYFRNKDRQAEQAGNPPTRRR